jgi:hypothetical protein
MTGPYKNVAAGRGYIKNSWRLSEKSKQITGILGGRLILRPHNPLLLIHQADNRKPVYAGF